MIAIEYLQVIKGTEISEIKFKALLSKRLLLKKIPKNGVFCPSNSESPQNYAAAGFYCTKKGFGECVMNTIWNDINWKILFF